MQHSVMLCGVCLVYIGSCFARLKREQELGTLFQTVVVEGAKVRVDGVGLGFVVHVVTCCFRVCGVSPLLGAGRRPHYVVAC